MSTVNANGVAGQFKRQKSLQRRILREVFMRIYYVIALTCLVQTASGAVPLPDCVIYGFHPAGADGGTIQLVVQHGGSDSLTVDGEWVTPTQGGTYYVFRIPLESGEAGPDASPDCAHLGDVAQRIEYEGEPMGGFSPLPITAYGVAQRVGGDGGMFKRGDANGDNDFNIADAIYILQNLFASGPAILCMDAGDSNDDGDVNIADAIYILQNLFASGPPIPLPGSETCGPDPTPDALDCAVYVHCGKSGGAGDGPGGEKRSRKGETPPPSMPAHPGDIVAAAGIGQPGLGLALHRSGAGEAVDVAAGGVLSLPLEIMPESLTFGPSGCARFVTLRNTSAADLRVSIDTTEGVLANASHAGMAPGACFHLEVSDIGGPGTGTITFTSPGRQGQSLPVHRETGDTGTGHTFLSSVVLPLTGSATGHLELSCRIAGAARQLDIEIEIPQVAEIVTVEAGSGVPFSVQETREGQRLLLRFEAEKPHDMGQISLLCRLELRATAEAHPGTFSVPILKASMATEAGTRQLLTENGQINLRLPQADVDRDGLVLLGTDIPDLAVQGSPALATFDVTLDGTFDEEDLRSVVSALLGINSESEAVQRSRSLLLAGHIEPLPAAGYALRFDLPGVSLATLPLEVVSLKSPSFLVLDFAAPPEVRITGVNWPGFSTFGASAGGIRLCVADMQGGALDTPEGPVSFDVQWLNQGAADGVVSLVHATGGFGTASWEVPPHEIRLGEVLSEGAVPFVRGDANADEAIDIADAIFTLTYLLAGGATPSCLDAADGNDDGRIDISDGLSVLQHLFTSGPALPPPSPGCGVDRATDALGCREYPPCEERRISHRLPAADP